MCVCVDCACPTGDWPPCDRPVLTEPPPTYSDIGAYIHTPLVVRAASSLVMALMTVASALAPMTAATEETPEGVAVASAALRAGIVSSLVQKNRRVCATKETGSGLLLALLCLHLRK